MADHIQRKIRNEPYLLSLSEEVEKVINRLKEKQTSAEETLRELTKIAVKKIYIRKRTARIRAQQRRVWSLLDSQESASQQTRNHNSSNLHRNGKHKDWVYNEHTERTLRKNLYKILLRTIPENQLVDLVNNLLKMHEISMEGAN